MKTANKDFNEESGEENLKNLTVEEELVEKMRIDAMLMESKVLDALKGQERRIAGLNRDLDGKGARVEELEQENSRRRDER